MKRLTLNYGARFEHFNASIPAESSPASTWIGARNFAEIPNVPNWNDWAVRFAAAYDLIGDGKTALKGNAGKYVAAQAAGFAQTFNGMSGRRPQTVTWNDANGDKTIINADGNIQINEVVGGTSNFGQITSRPDPNLPRGYNWEYSALLQHELMPRLSVTVGYYHRDFYNLQVTDNLNLARGRLDARYSHQHADRSAAAAVRTADRAVHAEPGKVGIATDNLVTYSTAEQDDLQRRRVHGQRARRQVHRCSAA